MPERQKSSTMGNGFSMQYQGIKTICISFRSKTMQDDKFTVCVQTINCSFCGHYSVYSGYHICKSTNFSTLQLMDWSTYDPIAQGLVKPLSMSNIWCLARKCAFVAQGSTDRGQIWNGDTLIRYKMVPQVLGIQFAGFDLDDSRCGMWCRPRELKGAYVYYQKFMDRIPLRLSSEQS